MKITTVPPRVVVVHGERREPEALASVASASAQIRWRNTVVNGLPVTFSTIARPSSCSRSGSARRDLRVSYCAVRHGFGQAVVSNTVVAPRSLSAASSASMSRSNERSMLCGMPNEPADSSETKPWMEEWMARVASTASSPVMS